jgi:amino acid transporter
MSSSRFPRLAIFLAREGTLLTSGIPMEHAKEEKHHKLGELFATAICGNDILSSTLYVSGITIVFAGVWAPLILATIALVLFFYKSVYTEVVEALPINGGAYNCLLNGTSKTLASVAGVTTILSYVATAVISAKTGVEYLHTVIPAIPVIPATIALIFAFALLVISGLKDSAKVATAIFLFHVLCLTAFVVIGFIHMGTHPTLFAQNLATTKDIFAHGWNDPALPSGHGILLALFLGFSSSLLGVSGFESSANFVEEQEKGVFRKTLRNMLASIAIFNPLIALVSLGIAPYLVIKHASDFLLADMAHIIGGPTLQYIIAADAFLVLSGAVLTSYVGVSGLANRMAIDACLPGFLSKENSKGSFPYIIGAFFILCTSILLMTGGNLLALAGVYTIAFLSVMSMFALGNLILQNSRTDLKRTYRAPLLYVLLALVSTIIGIFGNITANPNNLRYFLIYFIPALLLVLLTIKQDVIVRASIRLTKPFKKLHNSLQRQFQDITNGTFVAFIHHVSRIHEILSYIDRNETGRNIVLVHCRNGKGTDDLMEIEAIIPVLQNAGVYPHLNIQVMYMDEPFSPAVVDKVSTELRVRKNRIMIGSIHEEHQFDYQELGGARIIF